MPDFRKRCKNCGKKIKIGHEQEHRGHTYGPKCFLIVQGKLPGKFAKYAGQDEILNVSK